MKALRIQNLRSLRDTNFIDIKPITILVGKNSSGKSTFLRTFPLFRQSLESRTTGPLIWFGPFVDFGSFNEALLRGTREKTIKFHFKFILPKRFYGRRFYRFSPFEIDYSKIEILFTLDLAQGATEESTRVKCLKIEFEDQTITICINKRQDVSKFLVNESDMSEFTKKIHMEYSPRMGLFPGLRFSLSQRFDDADNEVVSQAGAFYRSLFSEIKDGLHRGTKDERIQKLILSFEIGSSTQMLNSMQHSPEATKVWLSTISEWDVNNQEFKRIRDLLIATISTGMLDLCDSYVSGFFRNVRYVAPVRATAERYYRLQGLDVNEVDFRGQNLAMFIRNLNDHERIRFREWMSELFGFSPEVRHEGGHISLTIIETESGREFNLADMGFGYSQVLPILTQLWMLGFGRQGSTFLRREYPLTYAIEQPELHLHASLQARLADAFAETIKEARRRKIDLRLIIETHSETIVNRFGHLIAQKQIKNKDLNVVIFDRKSPEEPTDIRIGHYDPDGYLTNWPFGFFEPDDF